MANRKEERTIFAASYSVRYPDREWNQTIHELDDSTKERAIRHGRRILRKIFPGARRIRVRRVWTMRKNLWTKES